ncbi:MAG: 3-oxoacyl-ACP reductase family protein [Armatimonadota bacterium]|nr:3-oxoacyl-ACP reductase family protein [Armatimonadota bacterium]
MGRLDGRVAIVTGASGGIGRGSAEAVREAIVSRGGRAVVVQADVATAEGARAVVAAALREFGRVDILVNNAGALRDTLVLRMSEEDWRSVLDVNLTGAFLCTKAVLREFVRQHRGRIINIASVVAEVGNPGQANYVAAKAGLIGLTKAVAREVASRGITVNAVAPGYIQAGMTESLREEQMAALLEQVPLGRAGKPEEVAAAVVFLASDDAAYITGQVLNVDGGLVMR